MLPAPGTGYRWSEHTHETCTPIAVPELLLPRRSEPDARVPQQAAASDWPARSASIRCPASSASSLRPARQSADQPGERNAMLFWAACRFDEAIAQGLIDENDARRILTEAASRIGLQNYEISKTIESAFGRAGQ